MSTPYLAWNRVRSLVKRSSVDAQAASADSWASTALRRSAKMRSAAMRGSTIRWTFSAPPTKCHAMRESKTVGGPAASSFSRPSMAASIEASDSASRLVSSVDSDRCWAISRWIEPVLTTTHPASPATRAATELLPLPSSPLMQRWR
jgi:hypothetical protein